MPSKKYALLLLILIPALALAAPTKVDKEPIKNLPLLTGDEVVNAPVVYPPYPMPPSYNGLDVIGDTVSIGTTWYENQHNGTIGRMLDISTDGYIHFDWMNGLNSGASQRHIYYNYVDPSGVQGWPGAGYAVESSVKAGFCTLDALDTPGGGIAFPAFHEQTSPSTQFHTAVGVDYFPHIGAFLIYEPEWLYENQQELKLIWPRIAIDRNEVVHVLSTENPLSGVAGDPQRHYYSRGTYDPNTPAVNFPPAPNSFELMTWTMTIAGDVATSDVSDRVGFAWTYSREPGFPGGDPNQYDNDIYVLIDDDGQDFNFSDAFNLTQFIPVDSSYLPGDTTLADMDTLRAYTDLNIFFDMNNWCHVVFTVAGYYSLEGLVSVANSLIFHWSEEFPGEFQLVANGWYPAYDPGAWNQTAQRPELGQNTQNGYLYCMYQVYDTTSVSAGGYPSGEIYMSMSTDGGATWSRGINVTNTISPPNAPAGQCLSELTPSMAKKVDDYCHVMYVLDKDAGNVNQTEGTWTLNPVIYHKIPISQIPSTPTMPYFPLHVEHGPPVGIPGAGRYEQPKTFALQQNYPNPFNPATNITFSLDEVSEITLNVYNLRGELVANLASGTYGTGAHTVRFDASGLASGVYVYKLTAGSRSLQQKMLLLK
jgi:hypothetical protein